MFMYVDSLYEEIVKVQVCDNYYLNGQIRTDEHFYSSKFIADTNKFANLSKCYEDNDDGDYFEEDKYYSADEVLEGLVNSLHMYEYVYVLKGINISNEEWDILFDILENYYLEKEFTDDFIPDMVNLNKLAVARALVYDKVLDLETYIESLKYLESNDISMDDIIGIIKKLGEESDKDFMPLITNDDGSYGCLNTNTDVLIVKNDTDVDTVKKLLEGNGLGIDQIIKVSDTVEKVPQKTKHPGEKIVNFSKYKKDSDN